MRRLIVLTAAAAALACSAQAQSQPSTPNSDPPASSAAAAPPSQPAAGASASGTNTAATAQDLSAGLAVKDSTGAAIGQISGVKTDAGGKRVATIKMGSSSFAVDLSYV